MPRYSKELEEFNKTYLSKDSSDELHQYKTYLYQLLELKTIEEINTYYFTTKDQNFKFLNFDTEIKLIKDPEILKAYIIIYFTKQLNIHF